MVTRPRTSPGPAAHASEATASPPSARMRRAAGPGCILPRMPKGYRALQTASTRVLFACAVVSAAPAAAQQTDIEAEVHGLILMNAFHTTDNVNNSDVPQ